MSVLITRGHPAMADATACIIPTNENLHLRGELGAALAAVGGPTVQNDAIRFAPQKLGSVVPVHSGATKYSRILASVAFPFHHGEFEWGDVEKHLKHAIKTALAEGHRKIAVPFFADVPKGDPITVEKNAAVAMLKAAKEAVEGVEDAVVVLIAQTERQLKELETAAERLLVEKKADDKPADKPVDDAQNDNPAPKDETPAGEPKAAQKRNTGRTGGSTSKGRSVKR